MHLQMTTPDLLLLGRLWYIVSNRELGFPIPSQVPIVHLYHVAGQAGSEVLHLSQSELCADIFLESSQESDKGTRLRGRLPASSGDLP